ncbi:MAG: D-glycero-beta-D-manno-heptose 1-phosphate adenylyltransferase [Candidatus Obscuribacterales bacterium]|nr:D-glycero-beta-D-manno-heptose 1-phosphate adenylyltransferase [Candidatus Obscuribacterales bacterium]
MKAEKVIERGQLEQLGEKLRQAGKTVVTTNGCFDILHVGHVRILQQARALGDVLIIGINSDASVRKLKGESRPINNEDDRAELLLALSAVDYVTVFDEDTPVEFLKLVKPNVHVKGADYRPENLAETPVVESFGGRVEILALVPGRSTTNVVSRIQGN